MTDSPSTPRARLKALFDTCPDGYVHNYMKAFGDKYLDAVESPSENKPCNVEGRNFYELCQAYRHASVDPIPQFEALKTYITTGKLPWRSYEE